MLVISDGKTLIISVCNYSLWLRDSDEPCQFKDLILAANYLFLSVSCCSCTLGSC